jgi:basic membrane protein A
VRKATPAIPLVLVALGVLAGCGGDSRGGEANGSGNDDALKVALLTSGPVSDAGWYAGAYEGLQRIGAELGAEISHQLTRTPAEFDEAFFSYAEAGYDLVFAHGFEYQDAAMRAGEQFPEMTIVVSGGGRVMSNVIPLIFRLEEASYLAGMVAGAVTRSGTIGMVGGVEIPPVKGTFDAFRAGALSVRDDVRVIEAFIGNWNDVAAAKEATVAQIRAGADVIIHNTDAASFGVFQAVREATEAGTPTWAMGMNSDQNHIAPEVILGSAVIRLPEALLEVARRYQAGPLPEEPIYTGIDEAVIEFVLNPDAAMADVFPEGLAARVDSVRTQIRSGMIQVPRVPFVEDEIGSPDAP